MLFKELDRLPRSSEEHYLADYVELLCLVNLDRMVTKGEILDRFKERQDFSDEAGCIERGFEEEAKDEGVDMDDMTVAEVNDKWAAKIDRIFEHLDYRRRAFGPYYPFVTGEGELRCIKQISKKRRLYVYLLLASNLRYIGSGGSKLTASFETASQEALRYILPKKAEVHIFGTSETCQRHYAGNLYNKIKKLAEDLREAVHPQIDSIAFSKHNSGDMGLDLVAFVPMKDAQNFLLVIFGQCACTEKWAEKQHSSSAQSWRGIIPLVVEPVNAIFIPMCFRSPDGSWYNPLKIKAVMFDRLRLVHMLGNRLDFSSHLCDGLVNEALASRESPF